MAKEVLPYNVFKKLEILTLSEQRYGKGEGIKYQFGISDHYTIEKLYGI